MVTAALSVPLRSTLERNGVASAAIVHGLDVTTPFGPYQRFVPRVFRALDLVMPVSAATGEACTQRGLTPDKLHVVRNGVDVSRFRPLLSSRADRRTEIESLSTGDAPLPESAVLLVSVGRQVPRKGFEWFIRNVLPRLPDHVHYWLAGTGPEQEAIQRAIGETGQSHRVRLLGRVSEADLQRLYRGADLFVMPNVPVPGDMEGFGVVMLEAGMNGLPTVGAGIEGIAEVITNGENGQLVPSGDADAFLAAIRPWAEDRSGLDAASKRARDFTRDQFAWSAVASDYVRALRTVVEARRG
jgi:phosphatidylinositol alpha-1,6-mannosyltransferase